VPECTREEAEELLLTIQTLADASQALSNLDTSYTGARGDGARLARRRAVVITTIVRTWGTQTLPCRGARLIATHGSGTPPTR
jgi:cell wall-associated NlpC family hydrolase